MAYKRKFVASARAEFDWLSRDYDDDFARELELWLFGLVRDAENRDWSTSLDASEILQDLLGDGSKQETTLQRNLKRLRSATAIERLKALLAVIRRRCPPWQFRTASRWFKILGSISVEIEVYYEIDHVEERVIFTSVEIVDDKTAGDG